MSGVASEFVRGSIWVRREDAERAADTDGAVYKSSICVILGSELDAIEVLTWGGARSVVSPVRFSELWTRYAGGLRRSTRAIRSAKNPFSPELHIVPGGTRVFWFGMTAPATVRRWLSTLGLRMGRVRRPKMYGPRGLWNGRSARIPGWTATVRGHFREPAPVLLRGGQ